MRFQDRVALVTGASRGIGRTTALTLARDGADVAVHFVNSHGAAEEVCEQIRGLGRIAVPVQADVTDRRAIARIVDEIRAQLGPVELLVNSAGMIEGQMFEELTPERWDRVIEVNLTGSFNMIWAVKADMIEGKFGRIVNMASIAALAVRPHSMPYAASKAGVISLTKCCCEPFAPHNIRINAVAPGTVDTDMLAGTPSELVRRMEQETPLGRVAEPQEMANVIAFLLSEESSYMTGTTVIVSGGRILSP